MDKRTLAIFAALGATLIYALNHTIAKDVMPTYVQGFGFIGIRLIGATILFWLLGLLIPKQPIDKADRMAFFVRQSWEWKSICWRFLRGWNTQHPSIVL